MPVKHLLWTLTGLLLSSSLIAHAEEQADGLGYTTHGYELGQGNTHSGPPTDYGHAHFTKPRYGNSAYYRSYHAQKDIIKEHGWDIYAAPGHWNPYNSYYKYNFPTHYGNYGYPTKEYSVADSTSTHPSDTQIERRLEKTLDGRCFELKREGNKELRLELPSADCTIGSATE